MCGGQYLAQTKANNLYGLMLKGNIRGCRLKTQINTLAAEKFFRNHAMYGFL